MSEPVNTHRTVRKPRRSSSAAQTARLLGLTLLCLAANISWAADDTSAALSTLAKGSPAAVAAALPGLVGASDPAARRALAALEAGDLYRLRPEDRLVIGRREGRNYALIAIDTGEALPPVPRRRVRRIALTNALRSELASLKALAGLNAPAAMERLAAVEALSGSLSSPVRTRLETQLRSEDDAQVRAAIATALAIADLSAADSALAIAATERLAGIVQPAARRALQELAASPQASPALRSAAEQALTVTRQKLEWYARVETLFFGLSLGSVLVLAAIGLAITFGVMGVINMAHGELIMLGAYTTYVLQQLLPSQLALSLLLSVPAAFLITAAVGIAIERGVIRHLYGRPLETLLATFGISLILQQTVRTVFSPLNRSVASPEFMQGSVELTAGLSFTNSRIVILVFALLVFAALQLLLRRSRLGLEIRAVAQNRRMARALGVRSHRIDALTFGLGAGIAGVAGVALSQLTNVGPNMGQAYIIDSFLVVVFGGVGNLWGTLVAGLSLGVLNKLFEPALGAVLAKVALLVLVIVFIQRRPQGLFPPQGRGATAP
ncbi:MAG: urea ABC transporter permease subunit UrtB [Pseudomonadota bacterium]